MLVGFSIRGNAAGAKSRCLSQAKKRYVICTAAWRISGGETRGMPSMTFDTMPKCSGKIRLEAVPTALERMARRSKNFGMRIGDRGSRQTSRVRSLKSSA
jgi:hypothetical protein